jgi:RNA 2',3'-cyclic 3'-phosphodiesterase
MTRTFIALELNESQQRLLGVINSRAAQELPDLRWVAAAGIHLTLAFLGELSDEQVAEAIHAAEEAAQQATPFAYRLNGLGIFGLPHQPRVIWMGIEDLPSLKIQASPMRQLHQILTRELEMHGFEVEKRPFSPHLTLARNKRPFSADEQQRLQHLLHSKQAGIPSSLYGVNKLSVMKSELSRTGARYTCLRECIFLKSNHLK